MRDYRKLEIWQLARQFAVKCYQLSSQLPSSEIYGLTSQIRRSAVSIAANIAEGVGRDSDAELLRFVRIALGSLNEVETLWVIAADLGFVGKESLLEIESAARDLGVRTRNFATKLEADIRSSSRRYVREDVALYDALEASLEPEAMQSHR